MRLQIQYAFTLVELLVVIAIVGILSGLIIVGMNSSVNSARIAKAKIFSSSLRDSLLANLISEWKLDQVVSNITNDSWSSNNCTLNGAGGLPQLQTSNCIYDNCMSFDGVDDYLTCTNNNNLNMGTGGLTISVWLKALEQPASSGRVVFKVTQTPAAEGYNLSLFSNGYLSAYIAENGTAVSVNSNKTNLQNAGWHYIVYSMNRSSATGLKLYVDAIEETYSLQADPTTIPNDISNTELLVIGRNNLSPTNTYYKGSIDDVRIYNAAIPTSQIREHYYAGLSSLLAKNIIPKDEYELKLSMFK